MRIIRALGATLAITSLLACGEPPEVETEVGAATTSESDAEAGADDLGNDAVTSPDETAHNRLPAQQMVQVVVPVEVVSAPNAVSSGIPADRDTQGAPVPARTPGAYPTTG